MLIQVTPYIALPLLNPLSLFPENSSQAVHHFWGYFLQINRQIYATENMISLAEFI